MCMCVCCVGFLCLKKKKKEILPGEAHCSKFGTHATKCSQSEKTTAQSRERSYDNRR